MTSKTSGVTMVTLDNLSDSAEFVYLVQYLPGPKALQKEVVIKNKTNKNGIDMR